MLNRLLNLARTGTLRRRIGLLVLACAAVWISFFDSHSLFRRINWHREADRLQAENEAMRAEIANLTERINSGLSDEMVTRIAREDYGMRLPEETVYRVETER